MPILTAGAIEGYKAYTERTIAYAKYKIGSTYYNVPVERKERLPGGRVAVYFAITPQVSGTITISEMQVYDTNNTLWAAKTEAIVLPNAQTGVLYRFAIDFKEVIV
jgi:hypothetical protein